jgi:peroxiredoxin Q/BCP
MSLVRTARRAALLLAASALPLAAQSAPATPKVGDLAPDFTITTVTADGTPTTTRLSSLRGRTVVLAFFPRARTSGCTAQMHTYRDRFDALFGGGKAVTLLAISTDAPDVLQGWAKDDKLPFAFGSDADGAVGQAYGAFVPQAKVNRRYLFVVDPDGRIAHAAVPFRELVEDAYTELAAAVARAGK